MQALQSDAVNGTDMWLPAATGSHERSPRST